MTAELTGLEKIFVAAASIAMAEIVKVGPKGYIHGWIYVGPKGELGHEFTHPEHGHGKVIEHVTEGGKSHVVVQHDSGSIKHYAATFAAQKPKLLETGSKQGKTHIANVKVHVKSGRVTNKDDGKTIGTVEHISNPLTGEKSGWGWQHEGTFDASSQLYPTKLAATKALIKYNNEYVDTHPIGGTEIPTHELAPWEKDLLGPDPADVMGPAPLSDDEITGAVADLAQHGESPFKVLKDPGKSGDGYAAPGLWGKYGAAGGIIRAKDGSGQERYLIVQRGPMVTSNKGKWQLPGGALDEKETSEQGFAREIQEELGATDDYLAGLKPIGQMSAEPPNGNGWAYTTHAIDAPSMFVPVVDGTETGDARWVTKEDLLAMRANGELHGAFGIALDDNLKLFDGGGNAPSLTDGQTGGHSVGTLAGYDKVSGSLGSNSGATFVSPTGVKYYVKAPKTDDHARNEVLANELYRAAGVNVPEVSLVHLNGEIDGKHGLGVRSKIVDDLHGVNAYGSKDLSAAREDFAVHAWLANYDAVGLDYSNLQFDDAGKPIMVDAGGSLLYRAQGKEKGSKFTDNVDELDTMRDSSINPQAAQVYQATTDEELRAGAKRVQAITPDQIDQMVNDAGFTGGKAATLKSRLVNRRQDVIDRVLGQKDDQHLVDAAMASHFSPPGHKPVIGNSGNVVGTIKPVGTQGKWNAYDQNEVLTGVHLDSEQAAVAHVLGKQPGAASAPANAKEPGVFNVGDQVVTPHGPGQIVGSYGDEVNVQYQGKYGLETGWHSNNEVSHAITPSAAAASGSVATPPSSPIPPGVTIKESDLTLPEGGDWYATGAIRYNGTTVGTISYDHGVGLWSVHDANGDLVTAHASSKLEALDNLTASINAKPSTLTSSTNAPGGFNTGDKISLQGISGHGTVLSGPHQEADGEYYTVSHPQLGELMGSDEYNAPTDELTLVSSAKEPSTAAPVMGHLTSEDVNMNGAGVVSESKTGNVVGKLKYDGSQWSAYSTDGDHLGSDTSQMGAIEHVVQHHNENLTGSSAPSSPKYGVSNTYVSNSMNVIHTPTGENLGSLKFQPDVGSWDVKDHNGNLVGTAANEAIGWQKLLDHHNTSGTVFDTATSVSTPSASKPGDISYTDVKFDVKSPDGKQQMMVDGNLVGSALKHPDGSVSVYDKNGTPIAAADNWTEARQKMADHVNAGKVAPSAGALDVHGHKAGDKVKLKPAWGGGQVEIVGPLKDANEVSVYDVKTPDGTITQIQPTAIVGVSNFGSAAPPTTNVPSTVPLASEDLVVKKDGFVYPKKTAGGGGPIGQVYKDPITGSWRVQNLNGEYVKYDGTATASKYGTSYPTRKAAVHALLKHHNAKNSSTSAPTPTSAKPKVGDKIDGQPVTGHEPLSYAGGGITSSNGEVKYDGKLLGNYHYSSATKHWYTYDASGQQTGGGGFANDEKSALNLILQHHNDKVLGTTTVGQSSTAGKPSTVHLSPHPTKPEKENVLLNSNDEKIGSVSTKPNGTFVAHDPHNQTISEHNAKFEATEAVVAHHAELNPTVTTTPKEAFAPHALKSTAAYNHPPSLPGGANGLPHGAKTAIKSYTGSGHTDVNDYLRFSKLGVDDAGQGGYLPNEAEEKSIMAKVRALDETFKLMPPTTKAIVVRRGVSDAADKMFGTVGSGVGHVFKDDGFLSTSTDKEFGGDKLEILIPAGAKVLKVGDHGGTYGHKETELLLPRSSRFKIISDTKSGYQRHTQLELIL